MGTSPFNFVNGKEVVLPTNVSIPSLALVQFIEETPSSFMQGRQSRILKIEEERERPKSHMHIINS